TTTAPPGLWPAGFSHKAFPNKPFRPELVIKLTGAGQPIRGAGQPNGGAAAQGIGSVPRWGRSSEIPPAPSVLRRSPVPWFAGRRAARVVLARATQRKTLGHSYCSPRDGVTSLFACLAAPGAGACPPGGDLARRSGSHFTRSEPRSATSATTRRNWSRRPPTCSPPESAARMALRRQRSGTRGAAVALAEKRQLGPAPSSVMNTP